jgi:hypothetical protein
MLNVNIWEGKDKWSLIGGSSVYGHAAITMPKPDHGDDDLEDLYISWWPSGDNSVNTKHGKIADRVKDRRFTQDLWAENSGRYLQEEIFQLPLGAIATLKKSILPPGEEGTLDPHDVKDAFKKNGRELGKNVLVGRVPGGGQWIVEDVTTPKAYLCFKGSTALKVHDFQGQRLLWDLELPMGQMQGIVHAFAGKTLKDLGPVPGKIKDLLKAKNYPLAEDSYIQPMSANQLLIKSHDKDTGLTFFMKDVKTDIMRVAQWSREYLAPNVNVAIPTLSVEKKGLDDKAIIRWWRIYNRRQNPKWSTFEKNCSVIVQLALRVGGAAKFAKPHTTASWLCWTPTDVKEYANAILKGIDSPKPKVKAQKTGGFDFNTDGIDWKTAGCVWTRDEFEKESKDKGKLIDIRSGILKDIDKGIEEYHKIPKAANAASYEKRYDKLHEISDKLAKFFETKPDSKRMSTIFELGERILVERFEVLELFNEAVSKDDD